jgi:hypothetical protein
MLMTFTEDSALHLFSGHAEASARRRDEALHWPKPTEVGDLPDVDSSWDVSQRSC